MSFDRFFDDFMRGRKMPVEVGRLTEEQKVDVREATKRIPSWLLYESKQGALGRQVRDVFKISYKRPETVGFTTFISLPAISKKYGEVEFERRNRFRYVTNCSSATISMFQSITEHETEHQEQITNLDMLRRVVVMEKSKDFLVQLLSGEYTEENMVGLERNYIRGTNIMDRADQIFYEISPCIRGLGSLEVGAQAKGSLADLGVPAETAAAVALDLFRSLKASNIHNSALKLISVFDPSVATVVSLANMTFQYSRTGLAQMLHKFGDQLGVDLSRISEGTSFEKLKMLLRNLLSEALLKMDYQRNLLDIIESYANGNSLLPSSKRRMEKLKSLIEAWNPYDIDNSIDNFGRSHPSAGFRHIVCLNSSDNDKELNKLILVIKDSGGGGANDDLVKTFCLAPDLFISNRLFARYKHDKKVPKDDRDFALCPMRFSPDFDCRQGSPLCEHERGWADAVSSVRARA